MITIYVISNNDDDDDDEHSLPRLSCGQHNI